MPGPPVSAASAASVAARLPLFPWQPTPLARRPPTGNRQKFRLRKRCRTRLIRLAADEYGASLTGSLPYESHRCSIELMCDIKSNSNWMVQSYGDSFGKSPNWRVIHSPWIRESSDLVVPDDSPACWKSREISDTRSPSCPESSFIEPEASKPKPGVRP